MFAAVSVMPRVRPASSASRNDPCTLRGKSPYPGLKRQVVDGAFAVKDIYLALLDPMRQLDLDSLKPMAAGAAGVSGTVGVVTSGIA